MLTVLRICENLVTYRVEFFSYYYFILHTIVQTEEVYTSVLDRSELFPPAFVPYNSCMLNILFIQTQCACHSEFCANPPSTPSPPPPSRVVAQREEREKEKSREQTQAEFWTAGWRLIEVDADLIHCKKG